MVWVIGVVLASVLTWRVHRRATDRARSSAAIAASVPRMPGREIVETRPRSVVDDRSSAEALRREVQQGSSSWGAGRFAVELARRDHEEWLATSPTTFHRLETEDPVKRAGLWGPVQSDVAHLVVEPDAGPADLRRPVVHRHPSVPRPAAVEDGRTERRARRRRDRSTEPPGPAPLIPAHELARLTPAARRLYGLPPVTG